MNAILKEIERQASKEGCGGLIALSWQRGSKEGAEIEQKVLAEYLEHAASVEDTKKWLEKRRSERGVRVICWECERRKIINT